MISIRNSQTLPSILIKICRSKKTNRLCFSSSNEEYTATPEYPPIFDRNPTATQKRNTLNTHEKYRQLNTVEEKLFALNMPRYYGWDCLVLNEGNIPFNVLPFVQYITRTKLVISNNLPINSFNSELNEHVLNKVKTDIQEAIILEKMLKRHRHETLEEKLSDSAISDIITQAIVEQINRILISALSPEIPHLKEAETDYEPRLEAFWSVGNFYPDPETYKNKKEELKKQEEEVKRVTYYAPYAPELKDINPEEPLEHWIQYFGKPCLQLRHPLPLAPLSDYVPKKVVSETTESSEGSDVMEVSQEKVVPVPQHRYDPGYYGFTHKKLHGTLIPGFWAGDPNEFGILSYHSQGHLLGRPPNFGSKDSIEALHCQAILAGYGWLLGQAAYQGFNTFNEITYPLTTATVITDGQKFSFYTSQLNTLLMFGNHTETNPKENLCYSIPEMRLYAGIQDGKVIGWNDETLKTLISLYLNKPAERVGINLKPNLHPAEHYICDIADEKRRAWLHNQFRHMYSNRPRKLLPYEIYDWEKIYKIKFATRPMDARRKPYELDQDPIVERKYSDHTAKYIKKSLREPTKEKQKFEDTYYPDV